MPIYEYECKNCGNKEEIISTQLLEEIKCEKCGCIMKLLISKTNFKVNGYNAKNGYGEKK